jgi:hypothetical protein
MADNVVLDPGTGGSTIKTDDDGTAHWQYVKVAFGPDNTQTRVTASIGLPTIILAGAAEIGNVKNSGTFAVQSTLSAETTKVIGTVNVAAGQTIATTNSGTFAVQSTLQAGTAEFGKLAAGTAEIGNVKNSGTFATQATLSAETTKVIGTVNMAAAQTIAVTNTGTFATQTTIQAGTAEIGKLAAGVAEIGNVKNSGTFATQATLQTGSNAIGKLAANSGVDIGDVDVTSISAGANLVGDVGISGARTSGGTTIFRSIDLDEGALEVVKASAGQIYWIHAMNLSASTRFVKIYDATSGTIGTGTPVLTFPIATQGTTNGAGFMLAVPNGIEFSTGISVGASTGIADADTGAPAANDVVINIGFA